MRWTVVFSDGSFDGGAPLFRNRVLKWLVSWLKPGFRHCWAYASVSEDVVLCFEPTCAQTTIFVAPHGPFKNEPPSSFTVSMSAPVLDMWVPRGLHTCVSQIKGLLGIGAYHVLTPHQLYVYLRKQEERDG